MASSCTSNCYSNVQQLINGFASSRTMSTAVYPNFGTDKPMYISVYFVLVKLMELMNSGNFAVAGSLIMSWSDPSLTWSPTANKNVTGVEIPSSQIWNPRLYLMNALVNPVLSLDASSLSAVNYNGQVTTVFSKIFNATCPIDITDFPFDTQTCKLTIFNVDMGRRATEKIIFTPALNEANTELFSIGGEFSYVSSYINSGVHGIDRETYQAPMLNLTFVFKRNPTYYLINVAMPSLIILLSSGLVFFLPSENNMKVAMACSLLMALYVLQQAVSRVLPTTPTVPLLATGIMIELGLGCYSVLCTVLTVSLRALQPPLCPCIVKLIKMIESFFDAPNAMERNSKTPIETTEHKDDSNANAALKESSSQNSSKMLQQANAVTTLVQSLKKEAELEEAKKLRQAEHASHWKMLDLILNAIFFFIYITIAIVACLKYLFGLGL